MTKPKPDPEKPILYAKAGVTPNADLLEIRLATNGQLLKDVVEADAFHGWYVQRVRLPNGKLDLNPRSGTVKTRKVWRKVKITRRAAR